MMFAAQTASLNKYMVDTEQIVVCRANIHCLCEAADIMITLLQDLPLYDEPIA
jgi:hypothetical protein